MLRSAVTRRLERALLPLDVLADDGEGRRRRRTRRRRSPTRSVRPAGAGGWARSNCQYLWIDSVIDRRAGRSDRCGIS
ncbi:MAG: hypothetical protein QOF84_7285 [Streptomyces sp.]|jgi:hypothetical protein|nr:hypothetical protein [Streptomyces sp.]